MRKKPNLLLITTDQQRADHLGLKGLNAIETPHLDRLGREGLHFDRAYCPSPICTPTRVSLLTGQYPSRHGAYSIGTTLPEFPPDTLPHLLAGAGYQTALFGKTHFVSRVDENRHMAGTEKDPPPEFFRNWTGPYLGFQTFKGSSGHTINNRPTQHYRVFLEDAGVDWKPWFPRDRLDYDHHACGPWNIPPQYHDTRWVADQAEAFIRSAAGENEPWFCWTSFQDPHEPFVCPEPWYSRVDPAKIDIPEGYREGEFDDRHPIYNALFHRELEPWNQDGNGVPSSFGTPERTARREAAMQATLGMVAFIDDRVGSILATLEQTGQLKNTLIIFTSDHGEMHGHHGLWGKGATAYEDCQRVPLLIWGPEFIQSRGTTPALINLVDLPRTLLKLAGLPIPLGMQGIDWNPFFQGAEAPRNAVLVECQPTHRTLYQQTLVTQRYKCVVYQDGEPGELYDLDQDPNQYRNLWDEPDFREERDRLLQQLLRLHLEEEGEKTPRRGFG